MPLSSMALYSNYTFNNPSSSDLASSGYPTQGLFNNTNNIMWGCQDNNNNSNLLFPPMFDNGAVLLDQIVSLDCDTTLSSAPWIPSFSHDQLDLVVPANNISDCKMGGGFYGGVGGGAISNNGGFHQNFNSRFQQPCVEECCGFVEDVKPPPPAYPNAAATENWGSQGNNQIQAVEEPNIKVGRYSEEERKERILRYLKKRNQRNFNKTIKYACRKTLADRRVRVRGRFARNNEICDQEDMVTKKHENNNHDQHHNEDFYGVDSFQFQLKNEDEEWLQEAMASLVYLSSSPEDM